MFDMESADFNSSNLSAGSFDNGTLTIEFNSGRTYQYEGVPQSVWDDLCAAPSAGRFFAQNIKNVFDGFQV